MRLDMSKTGQGAFSVTVDDDGTTIANGRTFKTPQEPMTSSYQVDAADLAPGIFVMPWKMLAVASGLNS